MKKFALLALLMSLGVFAVGCNKPADKPAAPATPADGAPATPAEGTPPAETK